MTAKKIQIYCDSGATSSKLKYLEADCEFYQFPYDSPDRPKKPFLLAKPSAAQWRDCNPAWFEFTEVTFNDFQGSTIYTKIKSIVGVGPENRRDVLHFDSAFKTGCSVFLTTDKRDLWSKRDALESLAGIKTFWTPFEIPQVIEYFTTLLTM